jgi:hypothetical protein
LLPPSLLFVPPLDLLLHPPHLLLAVYVDSGALVTLKHSSQLLGQLSGYLRVEELQLKPVAALDDFPKVGKGCLDFTIFQRVVGETDPYVSYLFLAQCFEEIQDWLTLDIIEVKI